MAKYLLLKHYRSGPAPAMDWAPMDQWTPDETSTDTGASRSALLRGSALLRSGGEAMATFVLMRSESETAFNSPWPLDAWPAVPTKFVVCTEDRFFPAEFMRRVVAERLGMVPDEIAAGHCVALSRPYDLANLLDSYVPAHVR